MSNFNNKSITNKGLELLSAAMAGGKLEFTRIVMGSGTYSGDIGVIESLVNQKQSLDIKSITKKGSQVILSTTLLQSAITEDFYWKEIGVYAKGADNIEVLYMYGSATDTSFISRDMLNEKMINVGVLVSNAQNVSATIDGSLVYLSRADLEAHNTSDSAHSDIRELIKQLEVEVENIDVSWDGISGKPSVFPPSGHTHSMSEVGGLPTFGNALGNVPINNNTLNVGLIAQHAKSADSATSATSAASATNATNATYAGGLHIYNEITSLKSTVVSGKTSVANAINGKLGTSLSNQTSFEDMAYYINQLFSLSGMAKLLSVTGSLNYQNNNGLPLTKTCQHIYISSQSDKRSVVWHSDRATTALLITNEGKGYKLSASIVNVDTTPISSYITYSGQFRSYIFPTQINVTLTECDSSGVVGFA